MRSQNRTRASAKGKVGSKLETLIHVPSLLRESRKVDRRPKGSNVIHTSEHSEQVTDPDSWCTPPWILDRIYKHFGGIGLDPCSNDQSIVRAVFRVKPPNDGNLYMGGLQWDWVAHGLCYINPPYSKIKPWVEKATSSDHAEIIMLIPVQTKAKWWHKYLASFIGPHVFCFLRGAVHFLGAPAHAPFSSVLCYWGHRSDTFIQAFRSSGWIVAGNGITASAVDRSRTHGRGRK